MSDMYPWGGGPGGGTSAVSGAPSSGGSSTSSANDVTAAAFRKAYAAATESIEQRRKRSLMDQGYDYDPQTGALTEQPLYGYSQLSTTNRQYDRAIEDLANESSGYEKTYGVKYDNSGGYTEDPNNSAGLLQRSYQDKSKALSQIDDARNRLTQSSGMNAMYNPEGTSVSGLSWGNNRGSMQQAEEVSARGSMGLRNMQTLRNLGNKGLGAQMSERYAINAQDSRNSAFNNLMDLFKENDRSKEGTQSAYRRLSEDYARAIGDKGRSLFRGNEDLVWGKKYALDRIHKGNLDITEKATSDLAEAFNSYGPDGIMAMLWKSLQERNVTEITGNESTGDGSDGDGSDGGGGGGGTGSKKATTKDILKKLGITVGGPVGKIKGKMVDARQAKDTLKELGIIVGGPVGNIKNTMVEPKPSKASKPNVTSTTNKKKK